MGRQDDGHPTFERIDFSSAVPVDLLGLRGSMAFNSSTRYVTWAKNVEIRWMLFSWDFPISKMIHDVFWMDVNEGYIPWDFPWDFQCIHDESVNFSSCFLSHMAGKSLDYSPLSAFIPQGF